MSLQPHCLAVHGVGAIVTTPRMDNLLKQKSPCAIKAQTYGKRFKRNYLDL